MSVTAIIAAAGSGERFGVGIPKALIQLGDRTLLEHAFASLAPVVDQIVISAPPGYEKQVSKLLGDGVTVVAGGATRSASVRNALAVTTGEYVLVHDAARALASSDLARAVIAALKSGESAVVPAVALVDTIKVVGTNGYVASTLDRTSLVSIQTPQGFNTAALRRAHAAGADATDDGALIEANGGKVKIIAGEDRALKITTPADLHTALGFLGFDSTYRTGIGSDAHAFGVGRPLWLAGLLWPDQDGVDGHSDGDVAAHAICDALFAATALGDLGSNFGTDRPQYAGASGVQLLQETLAIITKGGYSIANVTVQIIGNRPKIGRRRTEAIAAISSALGGAAVSLSATTTDGMGLTGEGKGIAAIASALVFKQ
ncbi:MAG: 2-C-methyl-D-erythritol 2,4-cyclodiphosphate synthase [Candidatus Planktophila sp.]|nr:2-C-methyl-D-erythritol 2,4-cyclodiphosphate synthase [Candidatus Planktophila sp.]